MDECEKVNEHIADRGFKVVERRRDFLYAALGGLYVSFWCPERSHIFDVDPLELAEGLKLSASDVLIVVAYRPYLIIDELQSVVDRIHRWYGRDFGVKIIGVNASDLEAGLEEAVGHAMAYRPFKIGQGVETGELCPNCTKSPLRIYVSERLFSAKYKSMVSHLIFACPSCGLRIRRVEMLSQI
ncbi:MAG: hypothetical protein QXP98_05605 [Thermoproteus sp.]